VKSNQWIRYIDSTNIID